MMDGPIFCFETDNKTNPSTDHVCLSKRWDISPEIAIKPIQTITQCNIYTILHQLLSKRFWKNYCNLHYQWLAQLVFSDTLLASRRSQGNDKCVQVFVINFSCCWSFPLRYKGDAHEVLLVTFTRDGMPPACICDNAKEMVSKKFHWKFKDALSSETIRMLCTLI